ncbi:hypothetical protein NQZ68_023547 [Dissostichus eleginoides]|nr:hypothetical protein NQZ68_023547 [Dissostichus eleginoides]
MLLILWITFAFYGPCLAIQLSKTHLSDSTSRFGEEPRPLRCYSREAMLELQCDRHHTNKSSHLCFSILDDIPREPLRNTRKKRQGRRGGVQNRLRQRFSRLNLSLKYPDSPLFEQTAMRTQGKPEEAVFVGRASLAAGSIADCVHELQLSHPDAPAIVLWDMKQ